MDVIIVPVVAKNPQDALGHIEKTEGDGIELRLDAMGKTGAKSLEPLFRIKPSVVTNRRFAEGGLRRQTDEKRVRALEDAIDAKPWAVDVELKTKDSLRKRLEQKAKKRGVKIIASFHDFDRTPSKKTLEKIVAKGLSEADFVKVVTLPKKKEDVENLMELVVRNKGRVVAFGLGDAWSFSRIESLKKGAPFGFARNGTITAAGQLTVKKMKEALIG